MDKIIEILRVAGEVTRLRIIILLSQGELAATEISSVLGQSQPRVSRHLKLIAEANIAQKRSEGAWIFLKLSNDPFVRQIIDPILKSIPSNDPELLRDLTKLREIRAVREEEAKEYFEAIAPEWERLKSLHQPDEAVAKSLKSMVKSAKFDFHVDLGSGVGDLLELMAEQCQRSEGLDRSRKMLAVARARLDDKYKNISVRLGDISNLPYNDNEVNLVTIHQVLHYLDNPEAAIKEAVRILAPNGTLLIADFAPHENEELRQLYNHKRLGFSAEEINQFAQKYGLIESGYEYIKSNNTNKDNSSISVNVFKFTKPPNNLKIDAPINKRNFA